MRSSQDVEKRRKKGDSTKRRDRKSKRDRRRGGDKSESSPDEESDMFRKAGVRPTKEEWCEINRHVTGL